MTELQFKQSLQDHGIFLSQLQLDQFKKYFQLLQLWNQKINLTSIISKPEVYEKHFFDSLTPAFDYDFNNKILCDVGTGAGFPSIPLKIVFPSLKILAIDSLKKRVDFVNLVIEELNLEQIEVIHDRVEYFVKENREKFDIVTARAVSELNILLELLTPLANVNGTIIAYKGRNVDLELNNASNAVAKLKLHLEYRQKVILPFSYGKRYNLIYSKYKKTPEVYPRVFSKIKKKPL